MSVGCSVDRPLRNVVKGGATVMTKTYEAPALVELGSFATVTGAGIGTSAEGWWPLADRA